MAINNLQLALLQADKVEQMLIDSGGEITPEIEYELFINPQTIGELVDVRYVGIERMESSIEFFDKKAEEFANVARSLKAAKTFVLDSIKNHMIETRKKELVGNDYQFKLAGAAPKVTILDESEISPVYLVTKPPVVTIDKRLIADDLKKGVPVQGAILEENYSLRRSVYKGK